MHCTPEKAEANRLQAEFTAWGIDPPLPPLGGFDYLFNVWHDIGLSQSSGGYSSGITWQEIDAYRLGPGGWLKDWEARLIHHMSRVYVSSYYASREPETPMPYQPEQFSQEYLNAQAAKMQSRLI